MHFRHGLLAFALSAALGLPLASAEPFTFQGYVENAGSPINGNADLKFRIYDAVSGGSQQGNEIAQGAWPVADGVFTIDLDAGIALVFNGGPRFLEVEVNGQVLSPRLEILPAPLASSSNALRGRAVSASAPAGGDVLTWTGTQWAAQAPSAGGGTYSAGIGLVLSGNSFSIAPSFQLPQGCGNAQVARWNGGAWACAEVADVDHDHVGQTWQGDGARLTISNQSADANQVTFTALSSVGTGIEAGGYRALRAQNTVDGGVAIQATTPYNESYGIEALNLGGGRAIIGYSGGAAPGSNRSTGVYGRSTGAQGWGIEGEGTEAGVVGYSSAAQGKGVRGESLAASGDGVGVEGSSLGAQGTGVQGHGSTGVSGQGVMTGVAGAVTGGSGAVGVLGVSVHPSAEVRGVQGMVLSPDALAVYGENQAGSGLAYGVVGATGSSAGVAVFGTAPAGGTGVRGEGRVGVDASGVEIGVDAVATATAGQAIGVRGASASPDGAGLFALNSAATGNAYGLYAQTNSSEGTAVIGDALAASGSAVGVHGRSVSPNGVAMRAENTSATGTGNALLATGAASGGDTMVVNANGSGSSWAIRASSAGTNGRVLNAQLTNNASTGVAIYSQVASASARAGQFVNLAGGEAARFDGNVNVVGNHTVSGTKSFRIDHPLDPENRYLLHYNLEGPEPFNLYRGTVKLEMTGAAEIELPEYFEAINIDLSYQLTAVGAAMPNLHVAREVEGNRFAIAGGAAGKRVSWQVTAVRNDPWVRDRGFDAELEKPAAEKGRYLYPAGYGQAEGKSIGFELRNEKSGAQ